MQTDGRSVAIEDTRPQWTFTEMSEAEFRKIYEHGIIKKIEAKSQMTSEDASRGWLEATNSNDKVITLPQNWRHAFEFVGQFYVPGLLGLNCLGERMLKTVEEIDAWECKNAYDRREYERLKSKFGA